MLLENVTIRSYQLLLRQVSLLPPKLISRSIRVYTHIHLFLLLLVAVFLLLGGLGVGSAVSLHSGSYCGVLISIFVGPY